MTIIPTSTVPSVKGYLFDGLKARTELAEPVLVCYDEPGPYEPDDIVMVGDVERGIEVTQIVGSGNGGWLYERYNVVIVVDCFRGGDRAREVFERAAALGDVVIDFVRNDPSLGGRVLQAHPSRSDQESVWSEEHEGRGSRVVITVAVYAQI